MKSSRLWTIEPLEARNLLTGVPYGASSQDTGEFLLGEVTVNVVFLESNGAIDADTEQWTEELRIGVKDRIEEGLQWWVDLLALHSDVHTLSFNVDYTYADQPVEISYEPISRGSQDFTLWIEEFFRAVQVPAASGFSTEIREFNHRQRVSDNTNWSFTIFVVNADNDANDQFGDANGNGTVFNRAFAYAGGQFIVMPHSRPPSTVAHEVGHMFWAHDEYAGSEPYTSVRGYYRTQNTNSIVGHPNPTLREPSIMASRGGPFENYQISQPAREMMGWRDSDGDGIFDVLDVPHSLSGTAAYNSETQSVQFVGTSTVQTLNNLNTAGTRNDMTLNRITDLQYRVDGGAWTNLDSYFDYHVSIDATTPALPSDASLVDFRTIDNRIGVTSEIVTLDLNAPMQNLVEPRDVNGDGFISPIDVLRVIIALNSGDTSPGDNGPLYLDVSGDGFATALDALIVINYINATINGGSAEPPLGTAEPLSLTDEEVHHEAVSSAFAAGYWINDEESEDWIFVSDV